jgi:L-alanine-DL-glutamate epimerase-like enolase superfamily enzyme
VLQDEKAAVGPPTRAVVSGSAESAIARVDLYSYDLTYVGGDYVMSGDRVISSLSSTVARIETVGGHVGFGESCPLGTNYLPAHAAGARAALREVAPYVLGLDGGNPVAVSRVMDDVLLGHGYGKSALDVACWDVFGQLAGRPVCDLLGGRQQDDFHLFFPISLDTPERMCAQIEMLQARGTAGFQLKVGANPFEDAARVRAVAEVIRDRTW